MKTYEARKKGACLMFNKTNGSCSFGSHCKFAQDKWFVCWQCVHSVEEIIHCPDANRRLAKSERAWMGNTIENITIEHNEHVPETGGCWV